MDRSDQRVPDPSMNLLAQRLECLAAAEPRGACPDENALAAMAERRLTPAEREEVEAHVARCSSCRRAVAAVLDEEGEADGARRRRPDAAERAAALGAIAACALIGVLLAGALRSRGPEPTRRLLARASASLTAARPDLFGSFAPFTPEELEPSGEGILRGGLSLHEPAGTIFETRPTFELDSGPGVTAYDLELRRADGPTLWRESCEALPCVFPSDEPDLLPGQRYVWRATYPGPFGTEGGSRGFTVASEEQRRAWDEGLSVIERTAPARVRNLLIAQLALRQDLLEPAEAAARRHLRAFPDDSVARATLRKARLALGYADN